MAVVTPTDRPKSVRNCCLIELFVALFVLSLCPFDISVVVGAFVIGLGQISSFLSQNSWFYCINVVFGPSIFIKSLNEMDLIGIKLQTNCQNFEASQF